MRIIVRFKSLFKDQDPEGWPYEPHVYWQLLHEKGVNDNLEIVENKELLNYYVRPHCFAL